MILAKKIDEIFQTNGVIAIVAIVIFLLSLISFALLIFFATINSKITASIQKSFDAIDTISILSIRRYFLNVERIGNLGDNNLEKITFWRKKIEKLYKIDLVRACLNFDNALLDKKTLRPTATNLKLYKRLNRVFQKIEDNAFETFKEIFNFLREEHLFRTRITFLKQNFDKLKDDCNALKISNPTINSGDLNGVLRVFQQNFSDYFDHIYSADYLSAIKEDLEINNRILYLLNLLDKTPDLFAKIKSVIPEKIRSIQSKFSFSTNPTIMAKIKQLGQYVATQSATIEANLKRLKYILASGQVEDLLNNIKIFTDSIEFSDQLTALLTDNLDFLEEQIDYLDRIQIITEKQYATVFLPSKIISEEVREMEIFKQEWKRTENFAYKIINEFSQETVHTQEKLLWFKSQFMKIIDRLIEATETLNKQNKLLSKKTTSVEKVTDKLVYSQSLITQCEIKIKKHQNQVPELKNFYPNVKELNNMAKALLEQKFQDDGQDTTNINQMNDKIAQLNDKIEELIININDALFLDYISQELIIYLERFVVKVPDVEKVIINLESLYHNRELNQLVGYWISVMTSINFGQVR